MTRPSWTEIQDRAAEFASRWQGETYEKGESQTFWSEFLAIFGIDGKTRFESVADRVALLFERYQALTTRSRHEAS